MKNNQKGITLVSLGITVLVMIILVSTIVVGGISIIESTKLQNLSTNMLLIQVKVKSIAENLEYEQNPEHEKIGGTPSQNELNKVGIATGNDNIKKIGKNELEKWGLNKVKGEFIVVYDDNAEVYYIEGYKNDNTQLYSLTDIENASKQKWTED